MSNKKAILDSITSWNSKNNKLFYIKESKIHGNGVFSSRDIKKGSVIGVSFQRISKNKPICVKDYNRLELGKFVNHSTDANVKMIIDYKTLNFIYKATKHINEGDEIVNNYNKFPWPNTNWLNESKHLNELTIGELLIFLSAVTAALTAIALKHNRIEKKLCTPIKDVERKSACIKRSKGLMLKEQIDVARKNKKLCDKTSNPSKCHKKLGKLISNLEKKLSKK